MTERIQKPLTDELYRELIKEDCWIDRISCPTPCYDSDHKFIHLCALGYPVEYIVTEEQKNAAGERAQQRKQELIEGIKPGELVFVSMGGNYASAMPDAVGNHRIRCHFTDGKGNTIFIELIRGAKTEDFYVDSCKDLGLEDKYQQESLEIIRHNSQTLNRKAHKPMPSQYYHIWFGHNESIPGTWTAVMRFINRKFHCNYTSARKIDHFVYVDDYVCTPLTA